MVICSIILREVSETTLPAGDTGVMTFAWRLTIVVRPPARERSVGLDATGGGVSCTDLREECRSWNPRTPVASIARTDDRGVSALAPTGRRYGNNITRCFCKAIRNQGVPEKITIDQSGSNAAAIGHYNRTRKTAIGMRQSKYLNNLIEQDQRAGKRVVSSRLGFQSFWAARCTIAGIEVMHAIRKGQLASRGAVPQTPAEQF